jgi:hypothetical protein
MSQENPPSEESSSLYRWDLYSSKLDTGPRPRLGKGKIEMIIGESIKEKLLNSSSYFNY